MLAKGQVRVDGEVVFDAQHAVNAFSCINVAGAEIQNKQARYIMLNKPKGYVSATKDDIHPTVLELVNERYAHELHIAGRLDLNTTGLILLTNDSHWSESLTNADGGIIKKYLVTTKDPIDYEQYQRVFERGIYFKTENITTKPATLIAINAYQCCLEITEGKYHQIKRMFGYFDNQVIELHRERIGQIELDAYLGFGDYRVITPDCMNLC
jgi:16S rRNA pseudouridine516 synthase